MWRQKARVNKFIAAIIMFLTIASERIDPKRQKLYRNRCMINDTLAKCMISNCFRLIKTDGYFYFAND
jgi:hypothetical protein